MPVNLHLAPKTKRPAGEPCCEPVVYPDVERDQAVGMAAVAKALGDPVRLQLVDVLRRHAGKVCVSLCRCSISPSRQSLITSRFCAKRGSSGPSAKGSGRITS